MSSLAIASSTTVTTQTTTRSVDRPDPRVREQPVHRLQTESHEPEREAEELAATLRKVDSDVRLHAANQDQHDHSRSLNGVAEQDSQHIRSITAAAAEQIHYTYTPRPVEHERPKPGSIVDIRV